ncbi:Protein CutA, chloroplastic [Apostasia shenzhenica]|uniref:Protein CutA, chloroplastic n=1 Tax=Apostasia shenzhenica TaxID=1088818 RepID=A0A2I0AVD1_9ASPA|nr:Protein CutA, chloroplastic [Apostasia shenzhenica]
MALASRFSAFALAPTPSRAAAVAAPYHRRRVHLVRALWVLSLGALTALAYRTGCAQSQRRLSLLRPKFPQKPSALALHSTGMAASSTVPSIVVYVTVPNREAGKKLAESIVQEKLAACVNIVPGIQSVYWWDGKVQTDSEELLIIKTRESLLNSLTEHVKSHHEYDVPEVIALPINGGNSKYLEWIKNSTRDN